MGSMHFTDIDKETVAHYLINVSDLGPSKVIVAKQKLISFPKEHGMLRREFREHVGVDIPV
jgi:hypothetical protein